MRRMLLGEVWLCIALAGIVASSHIKPSPYLNELGVKFYSSHPYQKTGEHEMYLLCTTNTTLSLQRAFKSDTLIHTANVKNCTVKIFSEATVYTLIAQGIKELNFKDSTIEIPEAAFKAYQLTLVSLSLTNCIQRNVLRLPAMPMLQRLRLAGHLTTELPSGMETLQSLTEIDLNNNSLSESCFDNIQWPELRRMILSHNLLTGNVDILRWIKACPLLSDLELSHNRIVTLTAAVNDTDTRQVNLRSLNLAHNNIIDVNWVHDLPSAIIQGILYLDLSYNRIEKLEHTDFEMLKHMSVLDLSYNNLKTLDYFVAAIPLPSKLNLAVECQRTMELCITCSQDPLYTSDHQPYSAIHHEASLISSGNPWICDCRLVWMSASHQFDHQSLPACHTPQSFKQFTINRFPSPEECPQTV